ncbi:MAG TPA: hypothetical protein VFN46_04695 [Acetobacteraceae bacterium]|nr:hypothetical protein [Acetobacteraceae bacterium]
MGRLWRRAPAWRLALAVAIGFTALAAMFPPAHLPWRQTHAPPPTDGTAARYVPQPAPPPSDYGVVAFPPIGPGRAGIIPFAGRQLPLPAGSWQELALARSGGAVAEQGVLLGRIEAGRLTGLMLAAGPGPVGGEASPVPAVAACFVPDAIAHEIIPAAASASPLARECWTLAAFDREGAGSAAQTDDVLRGGFDRLARMGVAVPRRMLALRYVRTDEGGWLTALLLLPDRADDRAGAGKPLQAWIRRYAGALHKGFDATLTPADLTPSVVRDPA